MTVVWTILIKRCPTKLSCQGYYSQRHMHEYWKSFYHLSVIHNIYLKKNKQTKPKMLLNLFNETWKITKNIFSLVLDFCCYSDKGRPYFFCIWYNFWFGEDKSGLSEACFSRSHLVRVGVLYSCHRFCPVIWPTWCCIWKIVIRSLRIPVEGCTF